MSLKQMRNLDGTDENITVIFLMMLGWALIFKQHSRDVSMIVIAMALSLRVVNRIKS